MNGPTLEAQDWHFYNFEWQNGIFVNIVARVMGPRELGLFSIHQPHTSSYPFSPTSIFVLDALVGVHGGILLVFYVFALVFAIFVHI